MSAEEERAERRRQATVGMVTALFRLAKACQLYDDGNQTVQQTLAGATEALEAYCTAFDTELVRLLFTPEMVFVNRRILRAPRESYALALQLGAMFEQAGFNELSFERTAGARALLRTARIVVDAQRTSESAADIVARELTGVTIRQAPPPDDFAAERRESPVARVVKAYAAALLVLKAFRTRFLQGSAPGAHEIKRVAQKLVALAESYPELLVAAASTPLPDDDPLRASTSSAVLALSMARRLTHDRGTLTAITHAALLAEVGALRLGEASTSDRLASSALVVLARMSRFNDAALRSGVITYEALREWPEAPEPTEIALDGEPEQPVGPCVAAVLVRTARQFNQLRTPRPGTRPLGIDEALRQLDAMASTPLEISAVRLLVAGMGFFPEGTLVELTTGEVAMVTGTPAVALDFARPPVRVMTDSAHRMLTQPLDVDLARPARGQPARSVKRALLDGGMPT